MKEKNMNISTDSIHPSQIEFDRLKEELEYSHYKLVRVSTNGLKGFSFHRLERPSDKKLNIAFFGPCAILPIVDYATSQGHNILHVAMSVDESRQTHFSPPLTEVDYRSADSNVVALPLRSVMAAGSVPFAGFENEIFWPRLKSEKDFQSYLEYCKEYISDFVSSISEILGSKPTFFLSFWEPRQNFMGSLFPRYDIQNPQFFVARLNMEMEKIVRAYPNTFLLDVNDILNSMGRFRIQDDYVREISHASNIFDAGFEDDNKRVQHSTPATHIYDVDGQAEVFGHCVFNAIRDNLAILQGQDPIKLIIMDLDDTLWRGVLADADRSPFERSDFWPMGLAEALLIYKARGGLLAICSKNDEELAKAEFDRVWCGRLTLNDFVSVKINFSPKSQNILEILQETNLLANNVLFVDDNPREINEVQSVIPDIRVLSDEHFDWRRAILLSPSTQVPRISNESRERTQTLRAKIDRDQSRAKMSREEWLRSLEIKQRYAIVKSENDSNFARAFELLNKTNQFNTTGKRWTLDEIKEFFAQGGYIFCVFLKDKATDNGLVGVHLVSRNIIVQSILSCRVFGLCSEYASMSILVKHLLQNYANVSAKFEPTGRNRYCESYFPNCGFKGDKTDFMITVAPKHPDEVVSDQNINW